MNLAKKVVSVLHKELEYQVQEVGGHAGGSETNPNSYSYSRARALPSLNLKKRRNVGSEMQECGRGYIKKVNKTQFVARHLARW